MDLSELLRNDTKVYVEVLTRHRTDGTIIPLSFVWEDGREYEIKKVLDIRRAASLKAGGTGLRYKIRVNTKETFVWLEEDGDVFRWFMERK